MLLGILGANLLMNLWTGQYKIRPGESLISPGKDF